MNIFSRLNLQQANAASDIENLREINRLRNELAAAEASNKTLSVKVKDLASLNASTEEILGKVQETNNELQTVGNTIHTYIHQTSKNKIFLFLCW